MKEYKQKLATLLKSKYGINPEDCISNEVIEASFYAGESIEKLVEWIASKYDLNRK